MKQRNVTPRRVHRVSSSASFSPIPGNPAFDSEGSQGENGQDRLAAKKPARLCGEKTRRFRRPSRRGQAGSRAIFPGRFSSPVETGGRTDLRDDCRGVLSASVEATANACPNGKNVRENGRETEGVRLLDSKTKRVAGFPKAALPENGQLPFRIGSESLVRFFSSIFRFPVDVRQIIPRRRSDFGGDRRRTPGVR